ncbi:MAG TPA: DUF3828 domain-containing protein [Terracidiphilus sp.]|nr:DUF3828 domain-containing protein [Terracidiphilus sp.]
MPATFASGQDLDSARAFLTAIYEKYQRGGKGIDFTVPDMGSYYDSSLVALFHQDVEINGPENVPAVDYDPICGCQDWDGIWDLNIDLKALPAGKAEAKLSFRLQDPKHSGKRAMRKLIVTLVPEHGQWRIYDVVDESDHLQVFSMRKLLMDDLAARRRERIVAR